MFLLNTLVEITQQSLWDLRITIKLVSQCFLFIFRYCVLWLFHCVVYSMHNSWISCTFRNFVMKAVLFKRDM